MTERVNQVRKEFIWRLFGVTGVRVRVVARVVRATADENEAAKTVDVAVTRVGVCHAGTHREGQAEVVCTDIHRSHAALSST
ncbi:hypothetical protein BaRGS_00009552 [Batillaria attramentaria]|uniref:Uncharacterized protein n=1 Tax=Batillaria attramentaria TaxID=370345 RepID=A0ABD0LIC3_9CAEN